MLLHTLEQSKPATLSYRDAIAVAFAELLNNVYVFPGSWFRGKLLLSKMFLMAYVFLCR